jgi:inner membrane protein
MQPATHLFVAWLAADSARLQPRDRALVTWCGVLPDLDGLGLLADLSNHLLHRTQSYYYPEYHHFLTHGLPAAFLLPGLLCLFGRERLKVLLWGVAVFHLHLLCDLVGSRGPSPTDLWPVYYLAPLARQPMLVWLHQWRLDGWPNFVLTLSALALIFWRAVRCGGSPVSLFSTKADRRVVSVLRMWAASLRRGDRCQAPKRPLP